MSPSSAWSHRVGFVLLMLIGIFVYVGVSMSCALASAPDLSGTVRLTSPDELVSGIAALDSEGMAPLDDRHEHGSRASRLNTPSDPAQPAYARRVALRRTTAGAHPCRHRPGSTRSSDDTPG